MKPKTYMDKLMQNKAFKVSFEEEYANVLISERIAELKEKRELELRQYTNEELLRQYNTLIIIYRKSLLGDEPEVLTNADDRSELRDEILRRMK